MSIEGPQGTLDGEAVGGQTRDRPPACQCDDLPDGVECWPCVHRTVRA
jgi:hypothetical protein